MHIKSDKHADQHGLFGKLQARFNKAVHWTVANRHLVVAGYAMACVLVSLTPSSGKMTSAAWSSEARCAIASVRSASNAGSAGRPWGTALATRMNPWLYRERTRPSEIQIMPKRSASLSRRARRAGLDR